MRKKGIHFIVTATIMTALCGCQYRKDMGSEEMESHKKALLISEENMKSKTSEQETIETSISSTTVAEEDIKEYLGFVREENICDGNATRYTVMNSDCEVRLQVNSAKIYNTKSELPEYFVKSDKSMSYVRPTIIDEKGEQVEIEEEGVYILVNISLKNMSLHDLPNCSVSNYEIVTFYEDLSGQKYGLSKIREQIQSLELDYDWKYKHPGKSFYFFDLKAGEEMNTNLCFQITKSEAQSELYLCNGDYRGSYTDNDLKVMFDCETPNRRYIRLQLEQ